MVSFKGRYILLPLILGIAALVGITYVKNKNNAVDNPRETVSRDQEQPERKPIEPQRQSPKPTEVKIALPTNDEKWENRSVSVDPGNPAQGALDALFKEQKDNKDVYSIAPKDSKTPKVTVKGQTARVDMDHGLVLSVNTEAQARVLIHSIVRTLTQIKGIESVLFLEDGKPLESLGEYDVSSPLKLEDVKEL